MGQKKQRRRGKYDIVLANLKKLFAGRAGKSQRAKIVFTGLQIARKREKARLDNIQRRLTEMNKPRPKIKKKRQQPAYYQPNPNRRAYYY